MANSKKSNDSLLHALFHHAKELEPVVGILSLGYALELQPLGWEIVHSSIAAQSYSLRKGNLQYHFRAKGRKGNMSIVVLDRYQKGKIIAEIKTRVDALRFNRARVAES